jgi:hypothetical protein
MRMKSGGLRLCVGALFIVLWAACYPGEIDSTSQTDIVLTFHKKDADFKVNNTLSLPDSIVDIGAVGGSSTFDHQYDAQILAKIQQEFVSKGYTFVDPTATQPDAVVLVAGITVDNYQAWAGYPWWGYWGWWGSWGYWGYTASSAGSSSWYYPWSPVVVTSYKSGTLFINLLDPDLTPPSPGQAVSIWGAALNGMLEGTNTEILSRISNNITQAFAQSPYLSTQ